MVGVILYSGMKMLEIVRLSAIMQQAQLQLNIDCYTRQYSALVVILCTAVIGRMFTYTNNMMFTCSKWQAERGVLVENAT